MSNDVNVFSFSGRVSQEPEVKVSNTGKKFARLSVANNRGFGDEALTSFFDCVCFFEQKVGFIEKYIKKGYAVWVEGEVRMEKYKEQTKYRVLIKDIGFTQGNPKSDSKPSGNSHLGKEVDNAPEADFDPDMFM